MSRNNKQIAAPTLAQYFEAPDDYVGQFGLICGYSAEVDFLNLAVERFTHCTHARRASEGAISLAVMLDPGNPQISPIEVPGVAHLLISDLDQKPFSLMHAKVALLGFMHADRKKWCVRLIVSTGNWTRQTVEESIDLAWAVEVNSDELTGEDDDVKQRCADIKAAREFLKGLAAHYDLRLLDPSEKTPLCRTTLAVRQLSSWLDTCEGHSQRRVPRFFDNRKASLLSQLPDKIRRTGADIARNCLSMASGFYEHSTDSNAVPAVISKIIDTLQRERLMTARPEIDVFVNPNACQSVAQSVEAMGHAEISVRPAAPSPSIFGENSQRTLHAKFLFGANYRSDSNLCLHAWLYIGSGNLTRPGFLLPASRDGGNLEAGVVFGHESLEWNEGKDVSPDVVVTNRLPVQYSKCIESSVELTDGGGMLVRPDSIVAAPVGWLRWQAEQERNGKLNSEVNTNGFDVLDANGNVCTKTADVFAWTSASRPRQVTVRWSDGTRDRAVDVPVVDEFGRIAAIVASKLEIEEAWWQLASFPMPPEEEEIESGGEDTVATGTSSEDQPLGARLNVASYPIREMMTLIEQIAEKQTEVDLSDWTLWCSRLQQTLALSDDSRAVDAFRKLGINPLSALRGPAFRPSFAESSATPEGQRYEETLTAVEQTWKVAQLDALGVAK